MAKLTVRNLGVRRGSPQHRQWLKGMIRQRIEEKPAQQVARELADLIDKLEHDRIRDPLTGAFNRGFVGASLQQIIGAEREHGHGTGLIMLDLDFFKAINDTEPDHHQAGDRTLVALAKLLEDICRPGVVGRWGGEEWLVVLPHMDRGRLVQTAQKIGARVAGQLAKRAKLTRSQVTASLGVRLVGAGETAAEAIGKVDMLVYQAKQAGRARMVYEQEEGKVGVVKFKMAK